MYRRLIPLVALLTASACVAQVDGTAEDEEELTTEAAMIGMLDTSQSVAYANVKATASKKLGDALVAAAHRGVDVHVLLRAGSHDTTWTLQQHLEASGVDVDVRADTPVTGVNLVADDKAVVGAKIVSTAATVDGYTKKFITQLAGSDPGHGGLLTSGVRVWAMPESSRDRIVQLLDAARTSIDLEIYQLQERRVVKALEDAAARGVKVRVMLEPRTVGAQNFVAVSAELGRAGVTVQKTPAVFDSAHNVDHAKFCIIDGKELLFGTGNLVRSGLGGVTEDVYANRDFWVEDVRASSVKTARALFEGDWAGKPITTALGDLVVTPDNADARIVALVDGARRRLDVYNQSLDDADLVARLVAAKQRGVVVRVLLGYQPGFGGAPPKNDTAIQQLKTAGIDAGYLTKHYLHAKAIVADDVVYIGSQNFTNGGLRNNREFGEVLSDAKAVDVVLRTFVADAQ
jgi:phosphatidylserine/phosphatidylglycerophosphate/cardiolipin synthase-like enzyme